MFKRSFSQVSRRAFNKGSMQQFTKTSPTRSTLKQTSNNVVDNATATKTGNAQGSFRTFAEYRLRISNQSPLAVRAKDFNANLRMFQH
ncbi:hypothetical protein KGF57_004064 [Candida theae]|uniref:Uncharacterized protein n=1 Tax=Candida theae TaxID=1198502 RepID=A0AAD5FX74_9ASCO|nr:uncharacterized protein KGF57_004064 [Candida theae]KAI5953072.1 hypothetical protein KGF57_004064 [Candida theae]